MRKILVFTSLLSIIACDYLVPHYTFKNVKNNSTDTIYVYVKYPVKDTILPLTRPYINQLQPKFTRQIQYGGRFYKKDPPSDNIEFYLILNINLKA